MDSKPPLQAKPVRRKVNVVYYLSRGGGQMDHPHLLEGYLLAAQDGLRLREFKKWLALLRGKSVPSSYAWSYKRTYKNGFIWHDLGENDLIQPLSKNEYVLMGSEIKDNGANIAKCKCGAMQQQTETKVVAEVGDKQQEVPLNKPIMRSPKVVTKSNSYDAEENHIGRLPPIVYSPARLAMLSPANKFHDSISTRTVSKSNIYKGSASSRSFNDILTHKLMEDVNKSPINKDGTKPPTTMKIANKMSQRSIERVSVRDCEIIADYIQNEIDDSDEYQKDGISDGGHDVEGKINGTYIMNAGTQTGESTRCSSEDNQPDIDSRGYANILEIHESPGGSSKLSTVQREFAKLSSAEKPTMISQSPQHIEAQNMYCNSSSNHTPRHNNMGSPGAFSSCSVMSKNARFIHKEGSNVPSTTATDSKRYDPKPEDHHHHHHHRYHQTKAKSAQNPANGSATSASHSLLKQLLTCGNADVVSEKTTNNTANNIMATSNNAMSGMATPARAGSVADGENSKWKVCKPGGLMRRMSSTASSDNRSVISATASDQASMMEMASSPESAYVTGTRHIKRDMVRAHSLAAASAAAAIRSETGILVSAKGHTLTSPAPCRQAHHHPQPSAAFGSTSPGMLSIASSASRRSSIKETEITIVGGGDIEEGYHEAMESHRIKMGVSSKARSNKGNKNSSLTNDLLNEKQSLYDIRDSNNDVLNEKKGKLRTHSTTFNELHNLICNPSGTPPYSSHNKLTSANVTHLFEQSNNHHKPHIVTNRKDAYTPPHGRSHPMLIPTSGFSRTPARLSNVNSHNISMLSKSMNSPSSLFMEVQNTTPSSSHFNTWKELIWSPRNSSFQKEKEKRHMKP